MACERVASARCRRCFRQLCRGHAPFVAEDCCDLCEDEYRPFSLDNLGIRLGVTGLATFSGAVVGLALSLVAGSLIFTGDPDRVRVLAMAAVMLATVIGFGLGNSAASALVRARFLRDLPSLLPRARVVRGGNRRLDAAQ
jgi:hypothetical protein